VLLAFKLKESFFGAFLMKGNGNKMSTYYEWLTCYKNSSSLIQNYSLSQNVHHKHQHMLAVLLKVSTTLLIESFGNSFTFHGLAADCPSAQQCCLFLTFIPGQIWYSYTSVDCGQRRQLIWLLIILISTSLLMCLQYGEIEEMNVCDNLGDHLVGNIYVKVM